MTPQHSMKPIHHGVLDDSGIPSSWDNAPRQFYIGQITDTSGDSTTHRTGVLIENRDGELCGYIKIVQPAEAQDLILSSRLCTFCGNKKPRTHALDEQNAVHTTAIGDTTELAGHNVEIICRDCSEQFIDLQETLCETHSEKILAHTI